MADEALWAYGVVRAASPAPEALQGVDPAHPVERATAGDLAALVSRVPLAEFGEEPLRRNLNDFAWLERVARRHEAVLEATMPRTTVVPLRMCTIFADEAAVERMLAEQHDVLAAALDALADRDEWAVKVIVDRAALEAAAGDPEPAAPAGQGEGAAYFGRRRAERRTRETADRLAAELAEDVHARLRERAAAAVLNRPQDPRLSGHEGAMVLNGAYLLDRAAAGELEAAVAELRARYGGLGARFEVSGPLPPFNFARQA